MNKNQRRKFLKTSLLSGTAVQVMPDKWLNPVINSVIMPSHAQTSDDTQTSPVTDAVTTVSISSNCENVTFLSEFDVTTHISTITVDGQVICTPELSNLSGVIIIIEYTSTSSGGESTSREIQTDEGGRFESIFIGKEEQVYQTDLMLLGVSDEFKSNNPGVIVQLATDQCAGEQPSDPPSPVPPAPPTTSTSITVAPPSPPPTSPPEPPVGTPPVSPPEPPSLPPQGP